jgi:phenylacetate-CoA ligase
MSDWKIDETMFPGISESGRAMIERLSSNPYGPILRDHSGHRLSLEEQKMARDFLLNCEKENPQWNGKEIPSWLTPWLKEQIPLIPFYRSRCDHEKDFTAIAPVSRADLSRDIAQFVPDGIPVDRMILFSSSGTTGYPLSVPSHPLIAARYLAFHKKALRRYNVELTASKGDVSVMLVGFQKRCFTYASVNPLMNEAGLVKINLNPDEWKSAYDRARYIDDLVPELITGDPLSLSELARIPFSHIPRAIMTTSMSLSPALREQFETRFHCPVVDIYSMNESGPIACWSDQHRGFLILQNRLLIEILSPDGKVLPDGERGEVTLTGGFNFYLPLIRYRTGDYASMQQSADGPLLVDLEGRAPVSFRSSGKTWFNNIDITHALASLALSQYALHQNKDGSLLLRLRNCDRLLEKEVLSELGKLLGKDLKISVKPITAEDKIIQYSTDLN